MEVGEGCVEVHFGEIGPHAIGEEEFGVGTFPEKKVGEPLFPAGADEQVDLGVVRGKRLGETYSEGVLRSGVGGFELGGCD
jgi:hypothetical protein